jgi:hypothetical protein
MRLISILFVSALAVSIAGQTAGADVTFDREQIVRAADSYLALEPNPITNSFSERSHGGIHDFYSEGDYWWSNPEDPDGPYIRRDGQTNPDNFTDHRIAMRDLGRWVAALTAAYVLTGEVVSRRRHAHEPESVVCPGHQGPGDRPGRGHHRHDPSD